MMDSDLQSKKYSSKLLLFGEYTVLNGSAALVSPFPSYQGNWSRAEHTDAKLADFLRSLNNLESRFSLDSTLITSDIERGICFNSDIRMGYGLGSSGALSAAALDRYFQVPVDTIQSQLKEILSKIESYFHGQSSGVDALAIYLNHAIQIRGNKEIEACNINWEFIKSHFFLVDSLVERKSQDLIKIYQETIIGSIDLNMLTEMVKQAISGVIEEKPTEIAASIAEISKIQSEAFHAMIPKSIDALWLEGQQTGNYTLKLLGAGGGGYALGFTTDLKRLPASDQIITF